MSWFQLATAYSSLCSWSEAVDAYERALALDPDNAVTMFDLGGAHWNSGNAAMAAEIWTAAKERFPDHELSAKLQRDFSALFSNSTAGEPGDDAP
ncbi:tetratricopeptide repeat protein [Pseudomonas sp.]|uniref:tetratricopeptide repeat protein n=1 Tax=Pseudomonas sp. TaxID=306 RepID=UPI00261D697C|nr:tetratricopeptide repeat protein [Pseudomonas sp.]